MFKDISWSSYGMFILITLLVYYATIGCLYYLNEIKQVFSGKSNLFLKLNSSKKSAIITTHNNTKLSNNESITLVPESDMHPVVSNYMSEIKSTLEYAATNRLIKQEIIYSLQQLTDKYSSIKDSPFKSFITNYIFIECTNYCSIHLDEDELKRIWAK